MTVWVDSARWQCEIIFDSAMRDISREKTDTALKTMLLHEGGNINLQYW